LARGCKEHGWAASFNAPIRHDGEVCGALVVYATEKRFFFGEKEAMLLEEVAVDISFAMAASGSGAKTPASRGGDAGE